MESVRVKQNNEALYHAASLLKDLNEQVVYVGGRIVGLLITDIPKKLQNAMFLRAENCH